VTKLKDKPFALIGVNVNDRESKNLKEVMAKEKMNWRSFADHGAINAKWNASTPTYYVLDPKGVIRHKWIGSPGARAIDTALERLINEAEGGGNSTAK
jgi:peroxiredoxin